ncbi:glycosyltransferase, partial [Campylobacter sp. 2018MI13]|uniref:glycosyltransferase n=1 Tax=Campylobacter sp. 2018MI13 TaxID=2836737 RepID=UPI001BD9FE8B
MQSSNCVAIIMATYNGEKYISKQLDSIINQAYKNIKIYINDDCSTDNTYSILKQYQKKYPYLINIKQNKNNIGFIKNFETLIKNCNEDFIALSDQDDIWDKNKLSKQMEIILKYDFQNTPLMI